jgi:hippurate hydrolase
MEVAEELFGEERVNEMPWPSMGSEDFSYILRQIPGAMVFLGATPPDRDPETVPQTHSNKVFLDEAALPTGVALHVAMAERLLERGRLRPGTPTADAAQSPSSAGSAA